MRFAKDAARHPELQNARIEVREESVTIITTDGIRLGVVRYFMSTQPDVFTLHVPAQAMGKALRVCNLTLKLDPNGMTVCHKQRIDVPGMGVIYPDWRSIVPARGTEVVATEAVLDLEYVLDAERWHVISKDAPMTSMMTQRAISKGGPKDPCAWVWGDRWTAMYLYVLASRVAPESVTKPIDDWWAGDAL